MTKSALALGFDTSGPWCAGALIQGDRVLFSRADQMVRGQAEALIPRLEDLLALAGAEWADLAVLGVGTGPGNFTGIRIGVSAARGLALGLGIPAVGITGCTARTRLIAEGTLAAIPAPREQVYLCADDDAAVPDLMPLDKAVALANGRQMRLQTDFSPRALAEAVAYEAMERRHAAFSPPAPLYARAADAAPARDVPPAILD